ncbi:MFS transporter [Micromonospora sp. 4G55]|uniref:MFS transporter n=1 Tax=Micromonospora sp. 4G55 TaxID=2806102 RepID=UPI001EE4819C|nr:MFS transporter [Micromonospora sp. 4G55]
MSAPGTVRDGSPAGSTRPAGPVRHRWLILAVLCLAQVTVVLDNTVLTVAIPVLTGELDATTADVQWMINAYALVQCGLLLTAGSAADRYGRRRMLLAGLVLFGAGSLAAGLAGTSGQLIAARGGMGIGGALLVTATLAVAMQIFDAAERPRAIGLWAATSALGFAAGPPIGGAILAHLPWNAIFLVNVPIVLVCLLAAGALVPESRDPVDGRLDLLGVLLSTAGLTGVVWAIISGPEHGWAAPAVLGAAGGGVLGLLALAFAVLAGARGRAQVLSRLRTMGLSRRQWRGLLLVELTPLVVVSVLTGAVVGAVLPVLLNPVLGLSAFTGGAPVTVRFEPGLVAGVLGLALLALAFAVAVETVNNRRMRLGEVLRLGEES